MATTTTDHTTEPAVTNTRAARAGELLLWAFMVVGLVACPAMALASIIR